MEANPEEEDDTDVDLSEEGIVKVKLLHPSWIFHTAMEYVKGLFEIVLLKIES